VAGGAGAEASASPDKLAEISAQEVRFASPPDVLRRRVHAQMPPGDTTRHASWAGALGGAVGAVPSTSLGRSRWSLPDAASAPPPLAEESTAAAAHRAVAQRALAAGTRALLYGSALAVVLSVVGAFAAADSLGIRDEADMRRVAAEAVAPRADALRGALGPWRAWLLARAEGFIAPASAGGEEQSGTFVQQLRQTGVFRSLVAARDEQRTRRAWTATTDEKELS